MSSGLLIPLPGKGILSDPVLHTRNLSVLLLSKLPRRAGVFSGLDSLKQRISRRPTRQKRGGFFIAGTEGLGTEGLRTKGLGTKGLVDSFQ